VPSHGGSLCVSLFLCRCFLHRCCRVPLQLALPRRSLSLRLRPRSPVPSTSSGSRRSFVRSSLATARPRAGRSARQRFSTLIASNVIVLSADPFGPPRPSLGKPWEGICFTLHGSGPIGRQGGFTPGYYIAPNSASAARTSSMKSLPPPWPASSRTWSRVVVQSCESRQAVSNGALTSKRPWINIPGIPISLVASRISWPSSRNAACAQ
jgi:hypothetical protein